MSGETFVRRVWLPTTLFVLVAGAFWWTRLSWGNLWGQVISTLLLTPLIWGLAIGKRRPPHPIRGLAVGALTGLVTQLAFHVQEMWQLNAQARVGQGDDQLANLTEFTVYVMIGLGGLVVGAILGLIIAGVERVMVRWSRLSAPGPDFTH